MTVTDYEQRAMSGTQPITNYGQRVTHVVQVPHIPVPEIDPDAGQVAQLACDLAAALGWKGPNADLVAAATQIHIARMNKEYF